jgi:large subunit ribosomal protein L1
MVDKKSIQQAISEARASAGKRKFVQSFDLIIRLKGIDPKTIKADSVQLPKGRWKPAKIVVIADQETALFAKKGGADLVIEKGELTKYDKKTAKKIAAEYEWFVPQMHLMQPFAKQFGPALGARGKMPLPKDILSSSGADPVKVVERLKESVRVKTKSDPVIQVLIGMESMADEDVAENAWAIYDSLLHHLPQGTNNLGRIMIKTTMGKPVVVAGTR